MTTDRIRADLDAIDIAAAETALAEAEAARHDVLLTGDDDDVLAAEAEITRRRIARDRAVARRAALEAELAEAVEADKAAAIRARYDAAVRLADAAEQAIRVQFPSFALRIIDIAEAERKADDAAAAINAELAESGIELPPIATPGDRVWGGKYLRRVRFADLVSLPETPGNPAFGAAAREVTLEAAAALGGVGQAPAVPVFQYR